MEYKLLSCDSAYGLTSQINGYLKEGWELYGNSCVAIAHSQYTRQVIYTQSLIKRKGEEKCN